MAADVIISYDGTFEEGDVDLVVAGERRDQPGEMGLPPGVVEDLGALGIGLEGPDAELPGAGQNPSEPPSSAGSANR